MDQFLHVAQPYAQVAPLVTATLALVAVVVAIWSLFSQKRIARGRAAIDFFLKTEMDSDLLAAYDKYQAAVEELGSTDLATIIDNGKYDDIVTYLNINELFSIGVVNKVFSDKVSFDFWCGTMSSVLEDAKPVIDATRVPGGAHSYRAMIKLNKKWQKRFARLQAARA